MAYSGSGSIQLVSRTLLAAISGTSDGDGGVAGGARRGRGMGASAGLVRSAGRVKPGKPHLPNILRRLLYHLPLLGKGTLDVEIVAQAAVDEAILISAAHHAHPLGAQMLDNLNESNEAIAVT